jgi:hypothetical protein
MKNLRSFLMASVAIATPSAFSQTDGSITFTPDSAAAATAVPTLGGAFLILLAALLGVIAMKAVRRSQQGGTIASVFAVAVLSGSLVTAMTGAMLMQEAKAGATLPILNPEGETFDVNCFFNVFDNQSAVGMTVTALTPPAGCNSETNTAVEPTACEIGLRLEDGESCALGYDGAPG